MALVKVRGRMERRVVGASFRTVWPTRVVFSVKSRTPNWSRKTTFPLKSRMTLTYLSRREACCWSRVPHFLVYFT